MSSQKTVFHAGMPTAWRNLLKVQAAHCESSTFSLQLHATSAHLASFDAGTRAGMPRKASDSHTTGACHISTCLPHDVLCTCRDAKGMEEQASKLQKIATTKNILKMTQGFRGSLSILFRTANVCCLGSPHYACHTQRDAIPECSLPMYSTSAGILSSNTASYGGRPRAWSS